jgi:hypothetical protein
MKATVSVPVLLALLVGGDNAIVASSQCLSSTKEIYDAESRLSSPDETNEIRTYTLCPKQTYAIGTLNVIDQDDYLSITGATGGDYPVLIFNPNVHIQCDGCTLYGGDIQLLIGPRSTFFPVDIDTLNTGVEISGITFKGAPQEPPTISAYYGDVLIKDCIFEVRETTLESCHVSSCSIVIICLSCSQTLI